MATFERGQFVYVRGEVLDTSHPEQLLVEFFSKTDQWSGWVLRDRATRGVVLDLPVEPLRIIGHLRTCADCRRGDNHWCHTLADQIEAQTKAPKPVEPKGLGAVVEDSTHIRWVRVSNTPGAFPWLRDGHGVKGWSEIDVVRVLSKGVPQ